MKLFVYSSLLGLLMVLLQGCANRHGTEPQLDAGDAYMAQGQNMNYMYRSPNPAIAAGRIAARR